MKLIYDQEKDHKYIHALTHAFLQTRKGEIISGMSARQQYRDMFGIDIDHHEWAYTLDGMTRIDECTHYSYHGGDTQYLIK